jgi:hypothetical protein
MAFNADAFLQQTSDPLATTFEVCPEGEFQFIVDSEPDTIDVREISGTSSKSGKPYLFHVLEVQCICLDQGVRDKLGRDKVRVRASMNLDFEDDGRIASGPNKNVALGQFRDALNQNKPGWKPADMMGAGPFMGRVKHTASKNNPEQKFAEIVRAARIS